LFGRGLSDFLKVAERKASGATIFTYEVSDPERYGIATLDENGAISSLEEKPENPKSNNAVVGLYFFDASAPQRANALTRSERGELEITDLNRSYLDNRELDCLKLPRGVSWFDMGTPSSMTDASNFIRSIEERTGMLVCSPEEVAFRKGLITERLFKKILADTPAGYYRDSLEKSTRGSIK
jgi:glucose-1-phosphate thymidylyltransferase